jgi:hypothetical protein
LAIINYKLGIYLIDLMRYLFIVSALLLFTSCHAQSDKGLIESWQSYQVPNNPDTLNKLGFSPADWTVFLENDKVRVANSTQFKNLAQLPFSIKGSKKEQINLIGRQSFIKVADGYLVGFYRGEWGGYLYWFSNDGKQYYKISDHEIVQFIMRENRIYAIEGLAHLDNSEGSILNIVKNNDRWIAQTYLKLNAAPEAIGLDRRNNLIIVTSKSLLSLDIDAKIKTLIETGIWYYGLYPNSLVILNDNVFIGMRKGVFKYDLQSGNQEWLLKD